MIKVSAKIQRRIDRISGKPQPLVTSFLPSGRKGLFIYAVVVVQHPDKVKIGMTLDWVARRYSYANWNLSAGDAIADERIFRICDEFVDIRKLENHILKTFRAHIAHGAEWFSAGIDDAVRHIDRVMCEHAITYDLL